MKTNSKELEEFNHTISLLLKPDSQDNPACIAAIQNIFDLLLWAEQKQLPTLSSTLQTNIFSFLPYQYPKHIQLLLNGMAMIFGNAQESGPIASHVLGKRLGDRMLRLYLEEIQSPSSIDQQERLSLLGGFLRAYHYHFKEKTFELFIEDEHCLLLEVCCKCFNCPQEITRTSVMNILMDMLKMPFIDKVLQIGEVGERVGQWCRNMCRQFRNQLKDFDQNLLITDEAESQYIVHSLNDKIMLWQDLSTLIPALFATHFHNQIILPLIVGSFNTNGIPLFTLKFALFVISKLVPTIARLGLLPSLGGLLFEAKSVSYSDHQLSTAILSPFSLKKLLKEEPERDSSEEDEPNQFKNLSQFAMNIFRSKDGRFLQCACQLLFNLLSAVKQSPDACQFFISKLGFGGGGATLMEVSSILITHFKAIHSLDILRLLSALLIYIQPSKQLDDQTRNQFIHLYRNTIEETLQMVEKQKEVHPYIAEVLEYDVKNLFTSNFSLEPLLKTDAALLFNNHIIENQTLPFYQQIPDTAAHIARYQVMKTLLLRKLAQRLIEECNGQNLVDKYNEGNKQAEGRYIKPGEYLRLPISVKSYKCKLQDGKISIPQCLLLEDDRNLIVGYVENMNIRIIINFKFKHTQVDVLSKKDRPLACVNLRRYSPNLQVLQEVKGFSLKNIDVGEEYFRVKKNGLIGCQVGQLKNILRKAKYCIPELNLI